MRLVVSNIVWNPVLEPSAASLSLASSSSWHTVVMCDLHPLLSLHWLNPAVVHTVD